MEVAWVFLYPSCLTKLVSDQCRSLQRAWFCGVNFVQS